MLEDAGGQVLAVTTTSRYWLPGARPGGTAMMPASARRAIPTTATASTKNVRNLVSLIILFTNSSAMAIPGAGGGTHQPRWITRLYGTTTRLIGGAIRAYPHRSVC